MLLSLVSRRPLEVGSRDAYGFALRPQHVERYREHVDIYEDEEIERARKWKDFIERQEKFVQSCSSTGEDTNEDDSRKERSDAFNSGEYEPNKEAQLPKERGTNELSNESKHTEEVLFAKESEPQSEAHLSDEIKATKHVQFQKQSEFGKRELEKKDMKTLKIQEWVRIRPLLAAIEAMLCFRVKKANHTKKEARNESEDHLPSISIDKSASFEDESDEYVSVNDTTVEALNASREGSDSRNDVCLDPYFPSQEELAVLVSLGVSKDLRGEVWQAFVGAKTRHIEKYYQNLLTQVMNPNGDIEQTNKSEISRKLKKQIDKDIPRTFPGHPALNDDGRDSLRRILLAYAYHNPSVGYCQAMNFVAGLLLLLMPEENAFWTFVGIIDDYFDGYYTEEMIESQVDQLVFEELMQEQFPKLVNHLDSLGVQVPWIVGPWFLSIFINVLPWETVFRIWDVLLFEGNRVILFRTALALMELYGPALVRTKDSGDAMTLLQTLVGSTFDSSQLILTACLGYMAVTESRLQELRDKHRPSVLEVVEERTKRGRVLKESKRGLSSKLYSFKHDRPIIEERKTTERTGQLLDQDSTPLGHRSSTLDDPIDGLPDDTDDDSVPDPQGQVVWLKVELCRLMEEKRSAELRAEELETALREMAKEDNRQQLSARIEQLEQELMELRQVFEDKKEKETALLQILMKVEQTQKVAEDARISADQDAAVQRHAVHELQEKYEKAMAQIAEMEKRMVMAETMLEATLQYERGQSKALLSPRLSHSQSSAQDSSRTKTGILSFGLGWRDSN